MVQELQQGAVHSVLNGIHHLSLSQNCFPLLLNARAQKLWLKRYLCKRAKYLESIQFVSSLIYFNFEMFVKSLFNAMARLDLANCREDVNLSHAEGFSRPNVPKEDSRLQTLQMKEIVEGSLPEAALGRNF